MINNQKIKRSGMSKFLRFIAWSALTLISIVIIIPVAAFLYFDPNEYKQEISQLITQKSGLPLEIHGTIEMKYFPWLGLSVQNVSMAQPQKFGSGDFVSIASLDFKLPVRELLERQFIIETLTLKGLSINLIQNKDGTSNWETASEQFKQKSNAKPQEKVADNTIDNSPKENPKKKLTFAIKQFDITDGTLSYLDKAQSETFTVNNLQLKGKQGEKENDFPLQGKLNLRQVDNKLKQTLLEGSVNVDGQIHIGENLSALFDTKLAITMPQNKAGFNNIDASLQFDLKPNKTILIDKMHAKIGDNDINGKITIPADKHSPINFHVNIKDLNLDKISASPAPKAENKAKPSASNTQPSMNAAAQPSSKNSSSRALLGDISIDKLTYQKIVLTNVKANISKTNDLVNVNPLRANVFQGTLVTQISKALNNPTSPVTLKGDLNNIQIQPLLVALKDEKRLSGTASVNFNLIQKQDLEGVVKVGIKNGVIDGIDVKYYLSVAQSLVSKNKTPLDDTKQTKFGDLSATLKIHDQMIDNNDLAISAPDFRAKGEGSIWLGSKTIEYKLQAFRIHSDNQEHPNDYPLAIRIKGNFDHPKVEPDVDIYLKKALEQEVKKQLGKQVEKNIGKILGNPTESQSGEATDNELQQKIEEKLNKGLKKLFKKKD
ncbi:MAG: AsmA family protein [Candidatus Berkiella sp.]